MIVGITLGSTSERVIRQIGMPIDRAASTYSLCLIASTCPRTMRATVAQLNVPITITTIGTPCRSANGPIRSGVTETTDASEIAKSRNGIESITSTARANNVSTMPPKKPAISPTTVPMSTVRSVAITPTSSEMREPYAIRTRRSRPWSSVPSQNVRLGGRGRPSGVRPVSEYCSFTGWPVSHATAGAQTATRKMPTMTEPARIAAGSCRSRSSASRHGLRPGTH